MAIIMQEILKDKKLEEQSPEIQKNLQELLEKMNKIRGLWAKPMTITSGIRTKEDQIRIYKELAIQRHQTFDESKIPWGSAHLKGAAVDISDPDYSLYNWCQENVKDLEEIGLWCEIKDDQHRVHFQIYQYSSYKPGGSRFFNP